MARLEVHLKLILLAHLRLNPMAPLTIVIHPLSPVDHIIVLPLPHPILPLPPLANPTEHPLLQVLWISPSFTTFSQNKVGSVCYSVLSASEIDEAHAYSAVLILEPPVLEQMLISYCVLVDGCQTVLVGGGARTGELDRFFEPVLASFFGLSKQNSGDFAD